MKHTKGKWGIGKGEFGLDINNGEGTIGTIYGDDTEAKANANLIASAPEMLSVLKEYVDARELDDRYYVKEMRTAVKTKDYRKSANILFMAIDIINKAEGK
jgi:hypothetical protein